MHQNPEFKIIAECSEGYIGICECCREFNFAFKNVLLTFQEEEMIGFFEWMIAGRDSCENTSPMCFLLCSMFYVLCGSPARA